MEKNKIAPTAKLLKYSIDSRIYTSDSMLVWYSIKTLFKSVVFSFPQPALSSHRHFLSLHCVHSNFCSCVCENSFVHLLSVDQSPGFQQLNLRPKQIGHNTYINPTIFNIICWVAGSLRKSSH